MTDKARIKIAAVVTALFLAAVSVAGIATRSDAPKTSPAAARAASLQQSATAVPASPTGEHEDGKEEGAHNE